MSLFTIICKGCSKEFQEEKLRKKYCSSRCREKTNRDKPHNMEAHKAYRHSPRGKELIRLRSIKWRQENLEKHFCSRLKAEAKIRGIEFRLTPDDIIIPEGRICPVLGIEMDCYIGKNGSRDYSSNANALSVDRFDNSKGYIPGNVYVISYRANVLKNNATVSEIELVLKYMKGENDTGAGS